MTENEVLIRVVGRYRVNCPSVLVTSSFPCTEPTCILLDIFLTCRHGALSKLHAHLRGRVVHAPPTSVPRRCSMRRARTSHTAHTRVAHGRVRTRDKGIAGVRGCVAVYAGAVAVARDGSCWLGDRRGGIADILPIGGYTLGLGVWGRVGAA